MNIILQQLIKNVDLTTLKSMVDSHPKRNQIYQFIGEYFVKEGVENRLLDSNTVDRLKEAIVAYDVETGELGLNQKKKEIVKQTGTPVARDASSSMPGLSNRQSNLSNITTSDPCAGTTRRSFSSC